MAFPSSFTPVFYIEKGLEYGKQARLMVIVRSYEDAKRVATLSQTSTKYTDFLFPASRDTLEAEAKNCDNPLLKALLPHGVAVILSESRRLDLHLIEDLSGDSHLHFLVMTFSMLRKGRLSADAILILDYGMSGSGDATEEKPGPVGLAQR